jgi:large subunit ribosomal protein L5
MANVDLRKRYKEEIFSKLQEKLEMQNPYRVPKLEKIIINMGMGEGAHNVKILDAGVKELAIIAGQKPVVTRAKKSIATFKIRAGMPVGAMVTLRGQMMYNFFQKLVCVALPRIRDFRGVSDKSFDGRGNYSLGLKEQIIFPEINYDEVDAIRGMNICIVTTAQTDEEAKELLSMLGMPFRRPRQQKVAS